MAQEETKKAHRRAERDKKFSRFKDFKKREELEKKRDEAKVLLNRLKHEKDPSKRAKIKEDLMKRRNEEEQEAQQLKKKTSIKEENAMWEKTLNISSDEDQFYDETIHLIAQNSVHSNDPFLFDPDSPYLATWDVFGLIFIIYQSIIIPFRLCFDVDAQGSTYYFEFMIDISFMIDILVQFNTAFYKRGTLIFNRWEIATNYFWSWFLIDFVASFPYAQVFSEDKIAQDFQLDQITADD